MQLYERTDSLPAIFKHNMFYQFDNKRILIADTQLNIAPTDQKMELDLVIISKNPKIQIASLAANFNCKLFVFDASNPAWKIEKWKQECRDLNLNYYSVPDTGAFIYNIGI